MNPTIINKSEGKTRERSKKMKETPVLSTIETIPCELITQILGRVAAVSVTDLFNVKLSSKRLNEISEDSYIYKHVSLDKFPVVPREPLCEKKNAFLDKCRESENPELMYREAVVNYFGKMDLESTCIKLHKALKSNHMGALYMACILLLLNGDDEMKHRTIQIMKILGQKLRLYRENLLSILKRMWVKNPILKQQMKGCSSEHMWKTSWDGDEDINCDACRADREIRLICETYNWR